MIVFGRATAPSRLRAVASRLSHCVITLRCSGLMVIAGSLWTYCTSGEAFGAAMSPAVFSRVSYDSSASVAMKRGPAAPAWHPMQVPAAGWTRAT